MKNKTVGRPSSQPTKRPTEKRWSYEFCVTIKIVINEDLRSVRHSECENISMLVVYVYVYACFCVYVIHFCSLAFRSWRWECARNCHFFCLFWITTYHKINGCRAPSFYMRKVQLLLWLNKCCGLSIYQQIITRTRMYARKRAPNTNACAKKSERERKTEEDGGEVDTIVTRFHHCTSCIRYSVKWFLSRNYEVTQHLFDYMQKITRLFPQKRRNNYLI